MGSLIARTKQILDLWQAEKRVALAATASTSDEAGRTTTLDFDIARWTRLEIQMLSLAS